LGIGDFRAWLACRELEARRCGLERGRAPAYGFPELAKLCGVSEKRARASVIRLVAAALLEWSDGAIGFPDPTSQVPGLEDSIGRGRGLVAIPRRMLRLLAGGARPALIATALGVLLRCLSRRRGGFDGRGRVKASWVADVFGIDLSRVKLARAELVALGWIEPEVSEQWAMNRWGKAYRIRLDWDRADVAGRRSPPPRPEDGPRSLPPASDREPIQERIKHQEPARRGGPAGVEPREMGDGSKPLSAPNIDDVRLDDLHDVGRTLELYHQAVDRKLASPSEDGRLKFLAVAEHARAIGTVNPGGLFSRVVRRGWWHFATQDDEDVARRRLRNHLHGKPRLPEPTLPRRSIFIPDRPTSDPSELGRVLENLGIFRSGQKGGGASSERAGLMR
jgi:hypothetical protein